ncbi:T9SS type A sorting domain-containing protein [Flavobacterium sp.]|uniref:T9SS type A sorting domain-containing protein n=1 Tax=Flavobacterium sp. TaxID=239 RepID=UPI003BD3CF57
MIYSNKKSFLAVFFTIFILSNFYSQVTLNANGPGNTYELITNTFAPGNGTRSVEAPDDAPDGSHQAFGRHIAEVFDTELNKYVFEFYSHYNLDNDVSTLSTDRQRIEIKTHAASPANLIGTYGENIIYKWMFKIPVGFKPSANFTHLHQIKAVDGDDSSPLFTLTPRFGNPNKLELIYVENATSGTNKVSTIDLSLLEGIWIEADEQIHIGSTGTYSITLKNHNTGIVLMSYANSNIATIRPDNNFIRPKWGIYRSLNDITNLRDEAVRFSDFSIQEVAALDINLNSIEENSVFISNPIFDKMYLSETIMQNYDSVRILDISGKIIANKDIISNTIDLSILETGMYFAAFCKENKPIRLVKIIKK